MALRAGHGRQEQGGGGVSLAAPLGASGAPPRAPACFLGRRESGSAAAGSPAPRASPLRALASAVARACPLCGRVHGRRGRGLSEKHERPVAGQPSRTRGSSWEPQPRPTARRRGARRSVACRPRAAQGGVPRPRHGAAPGRGPLCPSVRTPTPAPPSPAGGRHPGGRQRRERQREEAAGGARGRAGGRASAQGAHGPGGPAGAEASQPEGRGGQPWAQVRTPASGRTPGGVEPSAGRGGRSCRARGSRAIRGAACLLRGVRVPCTHALHM